MEVYLKNVSPGNVQRVVAEIRTDGSKGKFEYGTELSPLSGKQCWIYVLSFEDDDLWAVRVPVKSSHLPSTSIKNIIECESSILARLMKLGVSYSPKLIASDASFNNAIKFPYLVFKWIEGRPLRWTENLPASDVARSKIIRHIVDFTLDLARSTVYDSDLLASQHLLRTLDRRIVRILDGKLPENKLHDCLVHRVLIRKAFHEINDTSLCMISHDDLAPQNIIVDDDHNVNGVIDWGFARHMPLLSGLVYPRFISIEPVTVTEEDAPEIYQVSPPKFLQPSTRLQKDRTEYLSYLKSLNNSTQDGIIKYAISNMSQPQYDWHQLMFEAVHSKGLHRWLARRRWLFPGPEDEWNDIIENQASQELKIFLDSDVAQSLRVDRDSAIDFHRREQSR